MSPPTRDEVLQALAAIQDPDLHQDVVALGMIKDLTIGTEGKVSFTFELTTPACPVRDRFETMARDIVAGLPGVSSVELRMTSNVRGGFMPPTEDMVPGVKQIIAVASGKGGVGKSTVALNLAAALSQAGADVGLLDADVHGASVPSMVGVHQEPKVVDQKLQPLQAYGLSLMSIGFLAGSEKAMIWRGPMVTQAIRQMVTDVNWGTLDYLVIDLPPGTGDASLTVAQSLPLSGVVIVCTPQDVALEIAVKALQLFRSLRAQPLGLVENMSWFTCDECGKRHHIFDHGGGERAAQRLGIPYLGAIPLDPSLREEADAGAPVVISKPDSEGAGALRDVASAVAAQVSIRSFQQLPVVSLR